jgi:hypothetical protein
MDLKGLLSCDAIPGVAGNVAAMFVKSGSMIWFSVLDRNFNSPHKGVLRFTL